MCVPAPATEGEKVLPTIPAPVHVPPKGNAIKLTEAEETHTFVSAAATLNEGRGLTVKFVVTVLSHPLAAENSDFFPPFLRSH